MVRTLLVKGETQVKHVHTFLSILYTDGCLGYNVTKIQMINIDRCSKKHITNKPNLDIFLKLLISHKCDIYFGRCSSFYLFLSFIHTFDIHTFYLKHNLILQYYIYCCSCEKKYILS